MNRNPQARLPAPRAKRIATQRELLKALKALLLEASVTDPVGSEQLAHLRRMLPDHCTRLLRLRRSFELFKPYTDDPPDREPPWMSEPPDPAVLEMVRREVPPQVLATAWHDRWVTSATVASTLGISTQAARRIVEQLPYREVPNPHYKQSGPMRLVRLSDVTAWAAQNPALLETWQQRLASRRSARAAALRRAAENLRAVPERIRAATDSPAPLVCFWLALLNRAAKSGHEELYSLKDEALRTLLRSGVPFELRYLRGGDRPRRVWLCDHCRDSADELWMSPLEYIDVVGPCSNCEVEPAQRGYYDLYELRFSFGDIGRFCFHVPKPVGESYLPHPDTLPPEAFGSRAEESEDGWTFGRPLSRVETAAFSVEEIVRELRAALRELQKAQ